MPLTDSALEKSASDAERSYSDDDIESGSSEKVNEKDLAIKVCRICHLGLDDASPDDSITELGCSCKDDLGVAHPKCAEDWFKIKGNTVCEICGTSAANIAIAQAIDAPSATAAAAAVSSAQLPPVIYVQTRSFWHSRRIMNFLLGIMILAFLISWLFHFKVLS